MEACLGPRERREREREEIRGRILDAARDLFASEGVDSVTMRRIAERIEYSPTAIYFHFKDKDSLIADLCACDFRGFGQRIAPLARIEDPIERLRAVGHEYIDFGLSHPSHYRFMFMTPKPPQAEEASDVDRGNPEEDAYAFLCGMVAEAAAAGRLRAEAADVSLAAQVIWAGVHGIVSLEIAKCHDKWVDWRPIAERAKLMIDVLIDGITFGPKPSQGGR